MASRKRWHEVYSSSNPFGLPQAIAQAIRACGGQACQNGQARVKYLWLYVTDNSLPGSEQPSESRLPEHRLSQEEWLDVIDEAASLGVSYMIVSVGAALSEHPEVLAMSEWAQASHGMSVGVHLYGAPMTLEEARRFEGLDPEKMHLFVEHVLIDQMPFLKDLRLTVHDAMGQDQDFVAPECRIPEEMTCVGAGGSMYTCGLVLGDQEYHLGEFFERRLDDVMDDESLPHVIPQGLPKSKHRCNGCPPLMIQRMQQEDRA